MDKIQKKSLDKPDEVRDSEKFRVEFAKVGDITFARSTLKPGWRWSEDMKPSVMTKSCEVEHTLYQISGVTHVRMDDGAEMEFGPGDVGIIPPGHDAWVVGDEPAIAIDVTGLGGLVKINDN